MTKPEDSTIKIATSSIADGLDFACNLLSGSLSDEADNHPGKAANFLRTLTQYLEFRYVGELQLALEYLSEMGNDLSESATLNKKQFWSQLLWIAKEMGISTDVYDKHL